MENLTAIRASIDTPPENERAEVETTLRRFEELRRTANNNDLRGAYETTIGSLDGVVYRLGMLPALDVRKPARCPAEASVAGHPPPAPKATTPTERRPPEAVCRASCGGVAYGS